MRWYVPYQFGRSGPFAGLPPYYLYFRHWYLGVHGRHLRYKNRLQLVFYYWPARITRGRSELRSISSYLLYSKFSAARPVRRASRVTEALSGGRYAYWKDRGHLLLYITHQEAPRNYLNQSLSVLINRKLSTLLNLLNLQDSYPNIWNKKLIRTHHQNFGIEC